MSDKELIKKIKAGPFRMLIFGSSGSGKSHFLTHTMLPLIKTNYDEFVVFTRAFNKSFFQKMFQTKMKPHIPMFHIGIEGILDKIEDIKEKQMENVKTWDKYGNPIFRTNIMFVFDDILNEKLFKNDEFLEVFANLRHLQISTILCTQITNKVISTQMKCNTNFFVIFKLNDEIQQRFPLARIREAINKDGIIESRKLKRKAINIYNDRLIRKKYGYLIIDDEAILY